MKKAKNFIGFSIVVLLFSLLYFMQDIPNWLGLKSFYRNEINQAAYDFRVAYPKTITRLSDMRGSYLYLFFGFTQCAAICPRVMGTLRDLSASLERLDVKFVFVSIDPLRDTEENLENYAKAFGDRFLSLKLHKEDIKKVLNEYKSYIYQADLGKLKSQKNYQIKHKAFVYLINKEGILKYLYTNDEIKVEDLEADFQELSRKRLSLHY